MFESEVYDKWVKDEIPAEILTQFVNTRSELSHRSLLHWTEHCTECAMPACFKTCDLYSPRMDGKCARFVNGMEKVEADSLTQPLLKIAFKKWGVYASQGNHQVYELEKADQTEKRDLQISRLIHLPWPNILKKKLAQKRYSIKKNQLLTPLSHSTHQPDAFIIELYNPNDTPILIDFTIRSQDEKYSKLPFQYKLTVDKGYFKEVIPMIEIEKRVKLDKPYRVSLTPESPMETLPLYFGLTEFVCFKNQTKSSKPSKVKCIVWDLDHTIWDGVLIESQPEQLKLKEGIREILEAVENAGIINSIASKNDSVPALDALKHFHLDQFFVHPQISWKPKSIGIKEIIKTLDIGANSILFVDDNAFERSEVSNSIADAMVWDAIQYKDILTLPELQEAKTAEGKSRKELYINESLRKNESENFKGEYFDFLKSCQIELTIELMKPDHHDRVYELAQRTNQMNFSGIRYTDEDVQKLEENSGLDKYVLSCRDNFGSYGVIGFAVIDQSQNQLNDLMFSCRIQSKRVEHAFITFCLQTYLVNGDFKARYIRTEKNRFSGQVFNDFDFETLEKVDNDLLLCYPQNKAVLDDQIISIKRL